MVNGQVEIKEQVDSNQVRVFMNGQADKVVTFERKQPTLGNGEQMKRRHVYNPIEQVVTESTTERGEARISRERRISSYLEGFVLTGRKEDIKGEGRRERKRYRSSESELETLPERGIDVMKNSIYLN